MILFFFSETTKVHGALMVCNVREQVVVQQPNAPCGFMHADSYLIMIHDK